MTSRPQSHPGLTHLRWPLLAAALWCGAFISSALAGEANLTPAAKRPAVADFATKTLAGKKLRLSDHRGKVVVINFWATWCKPCKQELPFLNRYAKELEEKGLVVLAVSTDGPRTLSQVRSLAKRSRWVMPVLLDQDSALMSDLNPRAAMPFTLFIDRRGRLAAEHDGYATGDEIAMRQRIESLLKEPAP